MGSIGETTDTIKSISETLRKYDLEIEKRLRPEGLNQYVDISETKELEHGAEDRWIDGNKIFNSLNVSDGHRCKAVVVGTGFGALTFAVRLIEITGFRPEDLIMVDNSGGFGGTWYWNRCPNLMCDVESSCYMPLLEETGYIPKYRYAYGPELRQYAELVAARWNLQNRAIFAVQVTETRWDDDFHEWVSTISQRAINGQSARSFRIYSSFFVLTAGLLIRPKMPRELSLRNFKPHCFHTSRRDYKYTGGSPEDQSLTNLRGKRVAILGTGATAIQVVPALAKWVQELFVIQRTASSVDVRGQHVIDPDYFKENVITGHGWQRARRENMAALASNIPVERDMVQDGWTSFPSFSGLIGGPNARGETMEVAAEYLASLHILDLPRSERIRARVDEIVKDKTTAKSLKPWYAGWCKRPAFHDDYLEAFNRPKAHLIDTVGRGIDRITEEGFVANGKETCVDLLILSTGYETFRAGNPSSRARMNVVGRGGLTMGDKWSRGVATLHGVWTHDFPNLILPGGTQAGGTINVVHTMEVMATHVANVIAAARDTYGTDKKIVFEPTAEGEMSWSARVAKAAVKPSTLANCTPSYSNAEGKVVKALSPEEEFKVARNSG